MSLKSLESLKTLLLIFLDLLLIEPYLQQNLFPMLAGLVEVMHRFGEGVASIHILPLLR